MTICGVKLVPARVFLFDGAVQGDTEHILINAAGFHAAGLKQAHSLSFISKGWGRTEESRGVSP